MHRSGSIDSGLKSASLSVAAQRFLEKAATTDDLLQAYYQDPRVKRLIKAAARQFRQSEDFADELLQDLALLLINKFIQELQDPDKIYNVLHIAAVFRARRKSMRASEDSLDALLERTGDTDPSTSAVMHDADDVYAVVDERLDREKAAKEFNRRMTRLQEGGQSMLINAGVNHMPLMDFAPKVMPQALRKPIRPKKPVNDGTPSPEGIRLNSIRQQLGYTLPEFARILGCPKGTLSSYMYGSVQNVPTKLLEDAQLLTEQVDPDTKKIKAKFAERSMTEIVKGWVDSLGTFTDEKSADMSLATTLQVDRATVWRWRQSKMRPDSRKLEQYDTMVRKAVRAARRSSAVSA